MTELQLLWALAGLLGVANFASTWWLGRKIDHPHSEINRKFDQIERMFEDIHADIAAIKGLTRKPR